VAGHGRPRKSLLELVRDGTFLARKDHEMLADGPLLRWKTLAGLQQRYRACETEFEQRAVAREFEKAIPQLHERRRRARRSIDEQLAKLGPPGSAERAINFFPWAFRIPIGPRAGRRATMPDYQQRFVREFLQHDKRHRRVYTRGLLGVGKGNAKTPFAAGWGLEGLCSEPHAPQVYALAGSREQAGSDPDELSRLHALARHWANQEPLTDYASGYGRTIRLRERDGMFKILTSDGKLAQGVIPSRGLVEEFWQFRHQREREAVNALARALHKRGEGKADLLAISTAGFDKETPLGEMFDAAMLLPQLEILELGCLTIARDPASGFLMHWYAVPDDGDVENPSILRAANPLPTVSVRDLLRDLRAPGTDELDWRRLCANQWTAVREAWLPLGTWVRLADSGSEIPAGAGITIAVDAAYSWDTTAVVWAWRRPEDGRVLVKARVWTLRKDAAGHVPVAGPTLDNEDLVEPFILTELAARYRIKRIIFDPAKFLTEAKHLAAAGLTVAPLYPQGNRMREAESEFYKAAKDGRIVHDGDPILRAHVDATGGRRGGDGHWKISRLFGRHRPIDACIAAVMANWAELTLEEQAREPLVAWV
jgi:phage terminase large subunit-like protein